MLICAGRDRAGRRAWVRRAVGFRYKVDTRLRRALTDFADDSRHAHPWAVDIYARARARGMQDAAAAA